MERRAITLNGIVQGVGFRPFVHALATRLGLNGFVQNRAGAVQIEVEGDPAALEQFLAELRQHPPPLARIDAVACHSLPPRGDRTFCIEHSAADLSGPISIPADTATCDACLAELFDPADRRYRYPFINCTQCGPRLTIIQSAPYDRARTTMARFPMCPACRSEYESPSNRRFHAQPIACPACGPQLTVVAADGTIASGTDPLLFFAEQLRAGQIGALKGLGGYHLVCDATNEQAVRTLRQRKQRDEKPLAVMVRDLPSVRTLCEINACEHLLLKSPARPIVLLRKSLRHNDQIAEAVAPGNPYLGVMLPYTPLHHLLLDAVEGQPLVMTSGNRADEPIAYIDDDALVRLGTIADIFLRHDRPIQVRCDDSVMMAVENKSLPVRRSRGYAPQPLVLPFEIPRPILAAGGQLKAVFALGHGRLATLSHHLGDLDHFEAWRAFEHDIPLYEQLLGLRPEIIVHDLHPDYASTRYAQRRAADEGLTLLAVQHHHAHLASCLAEHGLEEPVIGVIWDGTGFGPDGTVWGGEFLIGDYINCTRAAHLRPVRLPGGEAAVREPWRCGHAQLIDAGCENFLIKSVSPLERKTITRLIETGLNSPFTSSAGRLFDAVAALIGVRSHNHYEGQAALQLEWLATGEPEDGCYPFEIDTSSSATQLSTASPFSIDTRPVIQSIAQEMQRGVQSAVIARRFHSSLVEIIVMVCGLLRSRTQLDAVVLSGGVFLNRLLTAETGTRLRTEGFRVYRHRIVPPGDGGLCLGQLAIAARTVSAP